VKTSTDAKHYAKYQSVIDADAAHNEAIWKKQPRGAIIPYTDSAEITSV
jgi:hypothetical protein